MQAAFSEHEKRIMGLVRDDRPVVSSGVCQCCDEPASLSLIDLAEDARSPNWQWVTGCCYSELRQEVTE